MSIIETTSENRARVLGSFDTAVRRSRKGRSTFVVTARRRRYHEGTDAVLDPAWIDDADRIPTHVRTDSLTLAALADAWIAQHDPDHDAPCTCDDLTATWMVPVRGKAREGSTTISTAGILGSGRTYRVVERNVRRCHCRPFPALLGSDLGRTWAEMTPAQMASGRWASRTRTRVPRARIGETFTTDETGTTIDHHGRIVTGYVSADAYWSGHTLIRRTPARSRNAARNAHRESVREAAPLAPWQHIANALATSLADSPTCVVDGVKVTVGTPGATGRFRATLVYVDGSSRTLQTRSLAPVARAILNPIGD